MQIPVLCVSRNKGEVGTYKQIANTKDALTREFVALPRSFVTFSQNIFMGFVVGSCCHALAVLRTRNRVGRGKGKQGVIYHYEITK
jgi:hypothetical protein